MSHFAGREEDIHNITGYLDFSTSDVQVVHIVGPPGFGKSTLAMKIGEIFVKKWVKVYYVDLRTVRNVNSMAEKTMFSIVESMQNKVTLNHFEKWVRNQYSNTLIILDNCDELFQHSKKEFLDVIRSLTFASSRKTVKYLLTSQKWVADIGNFRLHAIYNLSTEAAVELLGKVAPSLTDGQKRQIADLTGNVPLALDVIGAIFKFPDAPTPEEVIEGLGENLVATLSPDELVSSKVDVSIGIAYNYLTPDLKQLCVNLSHFPGRFNRESAVAIFDFNEDMLEILVQRSLLQHERRQKQFSFHQLLRMFFLQINDGEEAENLQYYFGGQFQLYFAQMLCKAIPENGRNFELKILHEEAHNLLHMFMLFDSHKHVNNTFFAIKVLSNEMRMYALLKYFGIFPSLFLLKSLESYSLDERASVDSFLETYVEVVILAARSLKQRVAVNMLQSRRREVDKGYNNDQLNLNTYTKFYRVLGNYYNEIGDVEKSNRCYAKILRKTLPNQLHHCYPRCDYFSISEAFENVGDRVQAFHFRKLALHHLDLLPMDEIKLLLYLYNDYTDASLGNDVNEAEFLSVKITQNVYHLMNADRSEYSEDTYYMAIEFFRSKNMKEHVIQLEKIIAEYTPLCDCNKAYKRGEYYEYIDDLFSSPSSDPNATNVTLCNYKCAVNDGDSAIDAFRKQYYYLAIKFGEQSFVTAETLGEYYAEYKCVPSIIVGMSHYHLGNYSAAKVWLYPALPGINNAIRQNFFAHKLRALRVEACFHLFLSGEVFNVPCYVYIVNDIVIWCSVVPLILLVYALVGPYLVWNEFFGSHQMELSDTTSLMEQKYSFIWSQFNDISNSVTDNIQQWTNTLILALFICFSCCYYFILVCCCSYICLCVYNTCISICSFKCRFLTVVAFILLFFVVDELSYKLS